MQPRKKTVLDYMFPIIMTFILIPLSLQLAVSYDEVKTTPVYREVAKADGSTQEKAYFNSSLMFKVFSNRIQKTEFEWSDSSLKFLTGALFISGTAAAYIITSKKKLISGKEHGTADWSKPSALKHLHAEEICKEEIKKLSKEDRETSSKVESIKSKYENADMILTQTEKICLHNYELNNNTLIVGGSGAGKTRSYVMPNLLQAHSSFVVTDPKGEILEKAGHFLKRQGYNIHVLNLDEKYLSDYYNPLRYVHRERDGWEERVLTLIETIIVNTDGGENQNSSDPFWPKAERLFLQACIFATIEAFPPEEANFNTVIQLIRMLQLKEDKDKCDSDLDLFFEEFGMEYGYDHIAYSQWIEFRSKASGKMAKSIVMSAVARLAPFKVKEIKRIFSKDNMELERVGEDKTAIFVVLPPIDETYKFVAGILFTQLFQELNYCALNVHKHDGGKLPVPVRFILDEFATTCKIPNFLKILAYARSLGIGITAIIQSIEQLKEMYEKSWGTVIDNCDTFLYLGKIKHVDTLKYLSEMLGKATFDKKSYSKSKGKQNSSSTSDDRFGRELLDPSEIRKLPKRKCLLFVAGMDAFYSNKYNYKKHPNYKLTSDGNKKYTYIYPHGEDEEKIKTRPHGEDESKNQVEAIKKSEIALETGDQVVDELQDICLNIDFTDDELMIVEDGESTEIDILNEEIQMKAQEKEQMLSILDKVIDCGNGTSEEVIKTTASLVHDIIKNPENFDFTDDELMTIEDGEPNEIDNILMDEELQESFEDININDISDFLNEISQFDTSLMEENSMVN